MVAFIHRPSAHTVPTQLTVPSLEEAVKVAVDGGGSVTSERRTAPGIASWVFVADRDGTERMLWEAATGRS